MSSATELLVTIRPKLSKLLLSRCSYFLGAVIASIYRKTLRSTSAVKQSSSVGEIVNLMSVDAQRFMDFMGFFHTLWSAPLQIAVAMYFLYELMGYAMFAGLITLILTLPLNAFAFTHVKVLQVVNQSMFEVFVRFPLVSHFSTS